jgi:DNA-binding IclR family transcriptional regulator
VDTTTIKALKVIEALSGSAELRGVAKLSRQLGLAKSNTFRILATLIGHPIAEQSAFFVGISCVHYRYR